MFISNKLKDYLRNSAMISGNSYYITSTREILGFATSTSYEELNKSISKDLLEKLLLFSIKILDENEPYFFANNKDNVIPIFDDPLSNIKWNSQIIIPIYIDDRLLGSLIMTSYHKTFGNKHLTLIETTKQFSERLILQYLNELKKGATDFI